MTSPLAEVVARRVRVAQLLIDLGLKFRRHADLSVAEEIPITQDELAARVGATREAVARALGALRREGVVETARHRIVACDRERLLQLANP